MSDANNSIIEETSFSRAEAPVKQRFLAPSPLKLSILGLLLALAVIAIFMFSARAVKFTFEPLPASFEITGGWPTWQLGERYLMLQGTYVVKAAAEGYYPFETELQVTDEPDQDYFFELERLPGILEISTLWQDQPVTDARVQVDQATAGYTPARIDEIAAGLREISITHPRFLPYQTEIDITGRREVQSITADLEPAWADVSVSSIPEGAEIVVDGEVAATTPATIELLNGGHTIRLRLAGYKTHESAVEVNAQEPQALGTVMLEKADGKLSITSTPAGANITVSGRYYGQTPLSIALAPGSDYELLATRAGYQNVKRQLSIAAEEDQSLNLRLNPVVGTLKLSVTPAGAALIVDGQPMGDPNQTLELIARPHELRIELPGYATYSTRVTPQPGFPQQLNIELLTEEEARVSSIPQELVTSQGDRLKLVIPGRLEMGAGRREPGRRSNEIQKQVELTRAFYIGDKEITNKVYKEFDPGHQSGAFGRALLSDPDRPVVNLSWEQAVRFCNWLSDREGLPAAYEQSGGKWRLKVPQTTGYRLPTEAEWAWAARYPTGNRGPRFPWGDNMPPTPGSGNFADETAANMVAYSILGYQDNFRGPAPPGTFNPNELGLYDLAGNVSEWINDYYSVELERELLTDPTGPEQGDYYVIRGSNYTHGRFSELRWTFRDYGSDARSDVGFRLARFVE